MESLPILIDAEEAIEFYNEHRNLTDAAKAYVVATLHKDGYSNTQIRKALQIDKVYAVTHLKRAGTALSEDELTLWHRNPARITLGHVRAIAKLSRVKREELLRGLLSKRTPVHVFASIAQGKIDERDADIKRYEQVMGDVLGRQVKIRYNPAKRSGTLSLDFYALDDLDGMARALGFKSDEHI